LVRLSLPPPSRAPNPVFLTLPAETNLFRLFDPTRHNATAISFRYFGPLLRFDHQRIISNAPQADTERGIYYGGLTLSCCIVEVFGDTGLIVCGEWSLAMPRLIREIRLLDLRDSGAMRAGSVAALGKIPDHAVSQTWSRHFYEQAEYGTPDGIVWYNAHNDEEVFVLYERAENALECPPDRVLRLDDPFLRPYLAQIAAANQLTLVP